MKMFFMPRFRRVKILSGRDVKVMTEGDLESEFDVL